MSRLSKLGVSAVLVVAVVVVMILVVGSTGGAAAAPAKKARASAPLAAAGTGLRGPRGPAGPRGPRGFKGSAGPAGQTGPAGPSQAFVQSNAASLPFVKGGASATVTLNVPAAGSYVIIAKASVGAAQNTGGTVNCTLIAGTLGAGADGDGSVITLFPKNVGAVTLEVAHTYSDAGTATFACGTPDSVSPMELGLSKVIAIHVGKITSQ